MLSLFETCSSQALRERARPRPIAATARIEVSISVGDVDAHGESDVIEESRSHGLGGIEQRQQGRADLLDDGIDMAGGTMEVLEPGLAGFVGQFVQSEARQVEAQTIERAADVNRELVEKIDDAD